jgi:hypothetical protein
MDGIKPFTYGTILGAVIDGTPFVFEYDHYHAGKIYPVCGTLFRYFRRSEDTSEYLIPFDGDLNLDVGLCEPVVGQLALLYETKYGV